MSRNCQGGCDITLLGVTAHVCSCNSLPTQTKKLQTAVQPRLGWGQTEVQTLHSLPLKWWIERLQKENACVGIFPTCHIKANFIISAKHHIILRVRNFELLSLLSSNEFRRFVKESIEMFGKTLVFMISGISRPRRGWHTFFANRAMHISGCCHALRMKIIVQPLSWAFCGTGMYRLSFYLSCWSSKFRMVTEINEMLLARALQIGNGKQLLFPPVSQTFTDNFFCRAQ